MVYGSEFIVEMKAGQKLSKGDHVCTLEYIDGSDIDDEAAYRIADHPKGKYIGMCLRGGGAKGKLVLVEFDQIMDSTASTLLFTLKKRMFERWLAETYPNKPAIPPIHEPLGVFGDALLNEAMASAELSDTPIP